MKNSLGSKAFSVQRSAFRIDPRSHALRGNEYRNICFIKSIFIIIFFSINFLYGEGFTTDATLNKQQAYIKEPVILTFDIKQTDHEKVMFFDFTLSSSDQYEFFRLDAKEEDSYQNAQVHYTYLLYPLKEGSIEINFELIQKVTTKENVAYSFSGDRDNVRGITTVDTSVSIAPLKLDVKPLPQGTLIVGDFTLTHKLKTNKANAHEPIPFSIEIKGQGYPPILENSLISKDGYTLFKEKPQISSIRTTKGTYNTIMYPLAFSAAKSFTFEEVVLPVFNPDTGKSYTLTIPKQTFDITPVETSRLVDKVDSPAPLQATDWSWIGTLFGYIVVFVAGFLTAKSVQWHAKEKIKSDPFRIEVSKTKDAKSLLTLLIAEDSKKYERAIEKLEAHIYQNRSLDLEKLKKEIHA